MAKRSGRNVLLKVAIGRPTDNPSGLTFLQVGAMRGKNIKFEWSTGDATADDSPDFTEESLVTFKKVTISGDGVYNDAASSNQETIEDHILTPGASTDYQPHIWVQWIYPNGKTFQGPFLATSWNIDAPHDNVMTYSMEATSAGAVTKIA